MTCVLHSITCEGPFDIMIDAMQLDIPSSAVFCLPTQPLFDAVMVNIMFQSDKAAPEPPAPLPLSHALHAAADKPAPDNQDELISTVDLVLEALITDAIEAAPLNHPPHALQPIPEPPPSHPSSQQLQLFLQTQCGDPIGSLEAVGDGGFDSSPPRPQELQVKSSGRCSISPQAQAPNIQAPSAPNGDNVMQWEPPAPPPPPPPPSSHNQDRSSPAMIESRGTPSFPLPQDTINPTAHLYPDSTPLPPPPASPVATSPHPLGSEDHPLGSKESEKEPLNSIDSFNYASFQSPGLMGRVKELRKESNRIHKAVNSSDDELAYIACLTSTVISAPVTVASNILWGKKDQAKIEAKVSESACMARASFWVSAMQTHPSLSLHSHRPSTSSTWQYMTLSSTWDSSINSTRLCWRPLPPFLPRPALSLSLMIQSPVMTTSVWKISLCKRDMSISKLC